MAVDKESRNEKLVEESVAKHRSGKANCAESIYLGFREALDVAEGAIDRAARLGGGRAPSGRCGALHAALDLARVDKTKRVLQERFEAVAGSEACREIRQKKLLSCTQCVELAAVVLAQHEVERG